MGRECEAEHVLAGDQIGRLFWAAQAMREDPVSWGRSLPIDGAKSVQTGATDPVKFLRRLPHCLVSGMI